MADSTNPDATRVVKSAKIWTTLITNTKYLSGLLTLDYSLKQHQSKYPLVALYTDTFPQEGHRALDSRKIPKKRIRYLLPSVEKDFSNDPRFYDCWSKLTPFSLVEYERVVQLDSDMLVLRNMDELMDLELDPVASRGEGNRVFAASHACVCNPMKKPHYPEKWTHENCAHTTKHHCPDLAQSDGPPPTAGLAIPNGGLQVVNPSTVLYEKIVQALQNPSSVADYEFADQSLLADLFHGRWVALPYVYNALKFMRWPAIHGAIWRDNEIRNIHYLLNPKPWDETPGEESDPTHKWWWAVNYNRTAVEKEMGIVDSF